MPMGENRKERHSLASPIGGDSPPRACRPAMVSLIAVFLMFAVFDTPHSDHPNTDPTT